MKRLVTVLAFLVWPLTLSAAAWASGDDLKPQDFAYGLTLSTDGQSSVYETKLPVDVYRGLTRPDLGDLRVFDANGEEVPFTIESGGRTEEELIGSAGLAVFPLREDANQSPEALSVMIHGQSGDSEVHVTGGETKSKKIVAYLFSTSDVAGPIRAMAVTWSGVNETFVLPVSVEASDDLKSWRTVTDDGVLSELTVDKTSLRNSRIEFPATKAAYFRLRFRNGSKPPADFELTSVQADYVTGTKTAEREWAVVKGTLSKQPRTYEFDLSSKAPVDRAEIILPDGNHVISADLLAADTPDEPNKSLQYSGILYRLRQSGHEMTTGPIHPAENYDFAVKKMWFLQLRDNSSDLDAVPSLRVGWVPQKLVFVAQGKGPYLLAYGSGLAHKPRSEVESLLQENAGITRGTAQFGAQKTLGGPEKLLPPPPAPPSAKEVWGKRATLLGMILATLFLGWMAYRLARQMA